MIGASHKETSVDTAETIITVNGEVDGVVTVANSKGAELPETGGMGTKLFYLVGGVLVIAAAVLLITRRRMSSEV